VSASYLLVRLLCRNVAALPYRLAMSEISAEFTLEFCGDDGKPVASAWTFTGFRLAALPHPGDLVLADFLPGELALPSFPLAEVLAGGLV
jgi:hypothetical protein